MNSKNHKLILISLVIYLLSSTLSFAQENNQYQVNQFSKVKSGKICEKIFVHTNDNAFITGETVWFKIFVVDAVTFLPLKLSSVAYVELMAETQNPVIQLKISLSYGEGDGSMFLPASIPSGNYLLRVYTRRMEKEGDLVFFHKTIKIANPFIPSEPKINPDVQAKIDVKFFPEGGNLLSNARQKVAFKGIDENGYGCDFVGKLIEDVDTVLSFSPFKFGMGNFLYDFKFGKRYKAIIQCKGIKQIVNLPDVRKEAYGISLAYPTVGKIKVSLFNESIETNEDVLLLIHYGSKTLLSKKINLNSSSTNFTINDTLLNAGVNHFTLFNSKMIPVAERSYFRQPNLSKSEILVDQNEFQKRSKVSGLLQGPPNTTFSFSVHRVDSTSGPDISIDEYLYMTSDVKGNVESPSFYFLNTYESFVAADNLMLTQGWSRYTKQDIFFENKSDLYDEPNWHIVKGTVKRNDLPAVGVSCFLATPSKIINTYATKSSKTGEVFFEMKQFVGAKKLYLQLIPDSSTITIDIQSPFYTKESTYKWNSSDSKFSQLTSRTVAMQVQDIYHKQEYRSKIKTKDSVAFYGKPDETYLLDDYTRFPIMEEVLREYVKGVFVRKRQGKYNFEIVNSLEHGLLKENPLIIVDGVPVLETNRIIEINPLKIKSIDLVTKKFFMGSFEFGGIISFKTYDANIDELELGNIKVINYEGLQQGQEFYSPTYPTEQSKNQRLPDFRYTLMWNPNGKTDNSGKAAFEFFTSDVTGKFVVTAHGLSSNGKLFTASSFFTTK